MNYREPKVSIIVPIYNVGVYIRQCAESLFDQTYENLELIFVDDCSTDGSIRLLKDYIESLPLITKEYRIIEHFENKGVVAARHTGFSSVTGDFVAYVDADDSIELNAIELSVDYILKNSVDVVVWGIHHIFAKKHYVTLPNIAATKSDNLYNLLSRKTPVELWAGVYKTEIIGNIDDKLPETIFFGEDWIIKCRLWKQSCSIGFLSKPLYKYEHRRENAVSNGFNSRRIDSIKKVLQLLNEEFSSDDFKDALNVGAIKIKEELLLSWAQHNGSKNDWNEIRNLFPECKRENIGFFHGLVLCLCELNCPLMLRFYVKLALRIKKLSKR